MSEGTSLSAQLSVIGATLRADAKDRAAQAGAIAALQALFLALLVRLFGRLENMVALWEAGQLPPPAPRTRAAKTRRTVAALGPRRAVARVRGSKQESVFFFEKKNQKTFIRLGRALPGRARPKRMKSFCFFFFRKRRFFLFPAFA